MPQDLQTIGDALSESELDRLEKAAHRMKSSVSILGISYLELLLEEMRDHALKSRDLEKLRSLYLRLHEICEQAIAEIKDEKIKFKKS